MSFPFFDAPGKFYFSFEVELDSDFIPRQRTQIMRTAAYAAAACVRAIKKVPSHSCGI